MVYLWGIDSYFNIESIQICDTENMISTFGLSGFFGSRVRSNYIGHNTYTGRRSNLCSKTTPIHGPVYKSGLNYSYSRSHFSRFPQAVANKLINRLSQKFSYSFKIVDPGIDVFSPNDESSGFHICDHSIFTFVIREKFIGFSNTSHVEVFENPKQNPLIPKLNIK